MQLAEIIAVISDILKEFDAECPVHKTFRPGIGPFGEPQLVREIAGRLSSRGTPARTRRTPDLEIEQKWALEVKIVRPFGDNGNEAENWSVNLLHPYAGNVSLIGDALKLSQLQGYECKGLLMVGFEHDPSKISLDPLIGSFESIARHVAMVPLVSKHEEKRYQLVHPEHQTLRCIGWQLQ